MRLIATLLLVGIIGISACSGGSNSNSVVQAGSTYSNASIVGTYSFATAFVISDSVTVYGTFVTDGTGNISNGIAYFVPYPGTATTCQVSFIGTYTLQSTAIGTMSMTPSASNSCSNSYFPGTANFSVVAGQQGSVFSVSGDEKLVGDVYHNHIVFTAIKQ
jgi:hypothetical protein